jgi:hypothetical protein
LAAGARGSQTLNALKSVESASASSLLGGIIALTLLMLPIMIRSIEEVISMTPSELKESSYALGTTRIETTFRVVLRQALPGIVTGVLLADQAAFLAHEAGRDAALELAPEEFSKVVDLNLNGMFYCAKAAGEIMVRKKRGKMINMLVGSVELPGGFTGGNRPGPNPNVLRPDADGRHVQ